MLDACCLLVVVCLVNVLISTSFPGQKWEETLSDFGESSGSCRQILSSDRKN